MTLFNDLALSLDGQLGPTSTSALGYRMSRVAHQHNSFVAQGLFWTFYSTIDAASGPFDFFYVAIDPVSTTLSTAVNIGTIPAYDAQFDIAYDSTNNRIHVVRNIQTGAIIHDGLEYRMGTPNSDGTITWAAAWQTVIATGNFVGDMHLSTDSNGNAWMCFGNNNNGAGDVIGYKNNNTDGTWSTASGFPITISVHTTNDRFGMLMPLRDGNMYAIVYAWATDVNARGYHITPTGTVHFEGFISDNVVEADGINSPGAQVGRIDANSRNGVVHFAYTEGAAGSSPRVIYRRRGGPVQRTTNNINDLYAFGSEIVLASGSADDVVASPRVMLDGTQTVLIAWTTNRTGIVWAVKSEDNGETFGPKQLIHYGKFDLQFEHLQPSAEGNGREVWPITHLLRPTPASNTFKLMYGKIEGKKIIQYASEAEKVFATMEPPPPQSLRPAMRTLINSLKSANVWQELDLLYVFAVHAADAACINWKNPGQYTATQFGNLLFTANSGFTGDGSSAYLSTNFNPLTNGVNFLQNDACYGGWQLNNAQSDFATWASTLTSNNRSVIVTRTTSDLTQYRINSSSAVTVSNTDSRGLFVADRSDGSNASIYKNGSLVSTDALASGTITSATFQVFLAGTTNFSSSSTAVFFCGGSLGATKQAALYSALQTYLQSVGAI